MAAWRTLWCDIFCHTGPTSPAISTPSTSTKRRTAYKDFLYWIHMYTHDMSTNRSIPLFFPHISHQKIEYFPRRSPNRHNVQTQGWLLQAQHYEKFKTVVIPVSAMEIVCCSIASWMATRSTGHILLNSSIRTIPPSVNTIALPSK